ncbi:uncharacterized protein LOC141607809 [Silene latifolia]|uniref:uncharacterized protein LOC141607809 n=1 Tax=Silene latifolia TaxID=37657 RepID=UPI003D76BB42
MVIKQIEAICRDFLWHGKESESRPAMVAWDKVYRAEKQGGLGIKNLQIWNCAAIANLAWRKICQIKTLMKDCIWAQNVQYSINSGYSWLLPDTGIVDWHSWHLNRWVLPKHRFICWLIVQQRLLTQDRLMNMGIAQHNSCYLCGIMPEDHKHLFFACVYSATCCRLVSEWCSFQIPFANCIQWWIALRSRTLTQKKALGIIVSSLMYHIWMCRNKSRVELFLLRPEKLVEQVKCDVVNRLKNCQIKCQNVCTLAWLNVIRSN